MGISIIDNFNVNAKKPIDSRFGPYESPTEALNAIDINTQRFQGLVVLITGSAYLTDGRPTEYWFQDGITDGDLIIKPGGSNIFPFTGSAEITGSLTLTGSLSTTGSVNLTLETSSTAVDNVMMYDSQSGQVFITSSAAIGGSSVIYTGEVVTTPQTIRTIKTLDFNPNDALVQFNTSNGELKFIFGDPPTPTVGVGTSGYNVNKFNLETQSFSVTGTYDVFSNEFISASLKETTPDNLTLEHTDIDIGSLTRNFVDRTGSKTNNPEYRFTMEVTSSDAIDPTIEDKRIAATTLTLNKSLPIGPSINTNIDEISNFGGQSQKYSSTVIEVGATGSISYTSSINNSNNWRFIEMENSQNPGITSVSILPIGPGNSKISGSIDIGAFATDQVFNFKSSASYDSDNGPGATPFAKGTPLNDPYRFEYRPSSTKIINRVRSVRAASFFVGDTGSVIANLDNLALFSEKGITSHTSNVPALGSPVSLSTNMFYYSIPSGNPNNVEISFCGPGSSTPEGNMFLMFIHDIGFNINIFDEGGTNVTNASWISGDDGKYKYYISTNAIGEVPRRPNTLTPIKFTLQTI